jgi:Short C-terminal domain
MIGEVRNGYGMHTADVIADNSVAEWLTNAVTMELEKAGYKVIISDKNNSSSNFEMGGSIVEVHCTAMLTYEGRVTFFVQLQRNGKILLQKSYTGNGNTGVNWVAASASYDSSIEAALSDAIKNLIPDVNTAINTFRDADTTDGAGGELKKLKELFDSGAITQDEYNTAKQKVLQKF